MVLPQAMAPGAAMPGNDAVTRRFAAFAAGLTYDALPPVVREHLTIFLLDYLRVASLGQRMPWSGWAVKLAAELGGNGQSTILFSTDRTDPERAQVNANAIRTELDRPTIAPAIVRTEPERVVHVRPEPERQRPSRTIVVEDNTGPMQRATEPLPPQHPVSTDVNAAHQPEGLNALVAVGIALLAVSAVVAVWFLLT